MPRWHEVTAAVEITTTGQYAEYFYPGKLFIMCGNFDVLPGRPAVIQGVDTELFDLTLNIERNSAINTLATANWPGEDTFTTIFELTNNAPECHSWFLYDIRLVYQNGVIILDD
jgi:hypothetical protein